MNMDDKEHLIKYLLILILGCVLAILAAWLTAMFIVIKLAQGISLAALTFIVLWCAMVGSAVVWGSCAFCWLVLGSLRKRTIHKVMRLSEAMHKLHASTNHEQIATIRYYNINIFKAPNPIPPEGLMDVKCRKISGFVSPLPFGFNKFFALGSPEYCCDAALISEIMENNRIKWGGEAQRVPLDDISKYTREIENLQSKYKEMAQQYTGAAGREGKLKEELAKNEIHMQILVTLANNTTKEFTHPLTKNEIVRKYKDIGKTLGVENAPASCIEIFRKAMPKEYINHGGAPAQTS